MIDDEVDLDINAHSDTISDSDNETHWEEDNPVLNDFTSPSGPIWVAPADTRLVEYFDKYFEPLDKECSSLWDFLFSETNKYFIWTRAKKGVLQKNSKMHKWKTLEIDGLRAFVGLILNL